MKKRLLGIGLVAGLAMMNASFAETAVFSGGCFWGVDAVYKHVQGVTEVVSGYAGGEANTAHYAMVSEGNTGHAESVRVTFDSARVSYNQLLQVFFSVAHNPTQLNFQGPDYGTQYRSAIFYTTPEQQQQAQAAIRALDDKHVYASPIVTQIVPLKNFYAAEEHHQNYLAGHLTQPYIVHHDLPKLAQLRKIFPALYRE